MPTRQLVVLLAALFAVIVIGCVMSTTKTFERFVNVTQCNVCLKPPHECGCPPRPRPHPEPHPEPHPGPGPEPHCPHIDWSKYVLKSSIPPCPSCPDMSRYMLKSECPAPPDMSKYILKTAVPPCPPCISTCNKPCKIGECPPCPVMRCPVVQCPEPKACAPCAAVEPPRCPEPQVTCKSNYAPHEQNPWMVRPLLASISPM